MTPSRLSFSAYSKVEPGVILAFLRFDFGGVGSVLVLRLRPVVAPAVPLVEASAGQGEGAVPTFAVLSREVDAIDTTFSLESPRSEDNPTMGSSESE